MSQKWEVTHELHALSQNVLRREHHVLSTREISRYKHQSAWPTLSARNIHFNRTMHTNLICNCRNIFFNWEIYFQIEYRNVLCTKIFRNMDFLVILLHIKFSLPFVRDVFNMRLQTQSETIPNSTKGVNNNPYNNLWHTEYMRNRKWIYFAAIIGLPVIVKWLQLNSPFITIEIPDIAVDFHTSRNGTVVWFHAL